MLEGYGLVAAVVCNSLLEVSLGNDVEAGAISNIVGVIDSSLCIVHRFSSLTHSPLFKLKLQSLASLFKPFNIKPTS